MARHSGSNPPVEAVSGLAGDQPGAIPVLDGAPTMSDLPTDQASGEPTGLVYHDTSDNTVKVAMPDGSGSVATGSLLDLSADVSLGIGDGTGLL